MIDARSQRHAPEYRLRAFVQEQLRFGEVQKGVMNIVRGNADRNAINMSGSSHNNNRVPPSVVPCNCVLFERNGTSGMREAFR